MTTPFWFQGKYLTDAAERDIVELGTFIKNLIIVPNNRLISGMPGSARFIDSLALLESVLWDVTTSIASLEMANPKSPLSNKTIHCLLDEAGILSGPFISVSANDRRDLYEQFAGMVTGGACV